VLGRLSKVDLRRVWTSEASDFTPWLALEENLSVLGETLGIELELEAQEKAVGPFRADILCRDIGSGSWVLIETQLERTDHAHLGQLLTYASGLEAATIIWIAARFNDEHRSTLDWLNKITEESFRFFGLEVELWQIGDSPAAPKFNIVSKPNDWSRSVAQGKRALDLEDLPTVKAMQLEYWTAFNDVLGKVDGKVPGNRKAQAQPWMSYAIGRTGFTLNAVMSRPKRRVGVEVYMSGPKAKAFFYQLREQKGEVERQLGHELEWEELPAGTDSRISNYLDDLDPEERRDWPRQHEWLAVQLNELHGAFAERVRRLDG
ncbi:MAG: DUF4268 domain-containing protein, partial [Gammaproteobacteria bacterium]|nr:DUF4268 domain-containing protein [Gammaproteobacteria bacterium]